MVFKRVAALLALVFGVAGAAGCLAGAYGVWRVEARLERANDKLFEAVDWGLKAAEDRLPVMQQRVRESKVTTAEAAATLREWGAMEVKERLASKLQLAKRAEKLSGLLREADVKLEASREALRGVQRVLEIGEELGIAVDPTSIDRVQERLHSLRESLQQAERAVAGTGNFAEGELIEDGRTRVTHGLARVALALTEADRRLDELAAQLTAVRGRARQAHERASYYILLGSVACYGLLAWMGAGQTALSGWGLRRIRG